MHQDSFRSVVCRSLSKNLPARSKDGSCPETAQRAAPFVVTLQPSVCTSCQGRERSPSQSYREERSMSFHGDYLMGPSLSKHFAEDLLRGAMDLQESLAMLERFQAVSQSMRHSNKKRRPEAGEESPEIDTIIREVLLRPSSAKPVRSITLSNGLHGQVSNSPDELKNVVKDSLYRKNLVSINNDQASLSQSKRHLSNNHLMSKATQQKKVVPKSFPSRAPVQPDKSKSPSLVAKLMGLDGLPSQNDNSAMKDESIKPVNSPRARFDIEMPNSKRLQPQLFGEKSGFDVKMRRSEKLPQECHNVRIDYTSSQKGTSTPYNNGIGSTRSVQRERRLEQARPKSPKEKHTVSPISRNQQGKKTTEINRRTRERQKPNLSERNSGRNDMKTKAGTISHNVKMVKKNDKDLVSSSSRRTYGSVKPILQKAPNKSREKTAPRRYVRSSTIDELVAYKIQREICHALDQIDGASTEHSATPSDESFPSADWDEESSIDGIHNDFSESNKASLSTSHTLMTSSTDEDDILSSPERILIKEAEIKDEICLLLLSDKSFLSRAAELFVGINMYEHIGNQYNRISEVEMKNHRLYLDIAAEQLEQKYRQQDNLCRIGIQGKKCVATAYFSLEALLRDISNGIRTLNSYSYEDASGTKDSLDMKLQRDLWCSDVSINGVWDMGWQDLICSEETDSFIRDAGEDILSLLIEEAALELSIH